MKRIYFVIKARWRIRINRDIRADFSYFKIIIRFIYTNKCTLDTSNKPFFLNLNRSTYLLRWNFTAKLKRESIVGNLRNVEIVYSYASAHVFFNSTNWLLIRITICTLQKVAMLVIWPCPCIWRIKIWSEDVTG